MKDILNRISEEGLILDIKEGVLQIFSTRDEVDGELISEIKNRKKELTEYLIKHKKSSFKNKEYQEIPTCKKEADYPVSNAQLRIWLASQFEEGSVAYNSPGSIVLDGTYDVACFQKAIHGVIDRHEILRTVFKMNASAEVRQHILSAEELNFEIDIRDLRTTANPQEACRSYISSDSIKPFNLATGPLLRASLFQLFDEQYVFYYNMHHIISDGWSMNVLSRDVMTYYKAYRSGINPDIPSLRIQYKDYTVWQLSELNNAANQVHKNYWLSQFSDNIPTIDLPSSKRRPQVKTYNGRSVSLRIPADITSKLRSFSNEKGGSMFIGLLATWNILLYRYTGETDITIGNPIAGREHPDLVNQIGFFINTLALRNQIDPDHSFSKIYEQFRVNTLEAYEHQIYPFDKLIEDLEISGDRSRNPLFDILVNHNVVEKNPGFRENKSGVEDLGATTVKFDLVLDFTEVNDCVELVINYNVEVYDYGMIEQLLLHYKRLVKSLLDHSEVSISKVEFLLKEEQQRLLAWGNNAEVYSPTDKTIVHLFAEQASKTPDNIAVVFEKKSLTYKQLNERSNQLARYLKEQGVEQESLIPIFLDRSLELLIGVLGILKSGGAYVPIDLSCPPQRLKFILEDTECNHCLSHSSLASVLNEHEHNLKVIYIDKIDETLSGYSKLPLDIILHPDQLVYSIYTSGSTGMPKGVLTEHKSVVEYLNHQSKYFGVNEKDTFLLFASIEFDASVEQMFLAIINGAKLIIPKKTDLLDHQIFTTLLSEHKVSHLHAVPSFLRTLHFDSSFHLKRIVSGGETFDPEILKNWADTDIEIYNEYGPTELTISATEYKINHENYNPLSIGKPIGKTKCYILGSGNVLQAQGVIGELCIGGPGVARGYLNRPELTKNQFVENPFSEGERMYKTGDLGSWLPDGSIAFHGRKDHQVKIRGYRIELGEIESGLSDLSKVSQAVVMALEDNHGEKELIAYIVSTEEINPTAIQKQLEEKLPSYMVPKIYVPLDEIPLTGNGKIDRKALPMPDASAFNRQEYLAPSTETEIKLVEIWQELLGIEEIGMNDKFFDLRGNSLNAIRLIGQYNKVFNKKVSIKDIFSNPVLKDHIGLLDLSTEEHYEQISKVKESESYPLSNAQLSLWLTSQSEAGSVAYNMPKYIVLNGTHDITCFQKAIHSVIERHEILRTVFRRDDSGEVRQYILPPERLNFSINILDYRARAKPEEACESYITQDFYQPFDLAKGPLLRASLLRLSDDQYVFYYNMHHIISDEWSVEVLSRDVMTYYQAYGSGTSPDITPLRIQYKDYTAWQLEQLEGDIGQTHKDYWFSQLADEVATIELPIKKRRPQIRTYNGRSIGAHLSEDIISKLRKYTSDRGGSLFTGVLAAWKILLYRYTGQADITIGNLVAGRNHVDLENQIGYYLNLLVLRNQISPDKSFKELYEQIKANTLEAFEHQKYPFDLLVEDLGVRRDPGRNPLFDILFSYHGISDTDSNIKEGNVFEVLGDGIVKFDIELHLIETGKGANISINYNQDVYEQDMIENLIVHYKNIIKELLEHPEESISRIQYLSPEEINKQLFDFNAYCVDYPKDKTIADLFVKQVQKTPNAIAVVYEAETLTYKELDEKSNQLARYLQSEGVVNETLVPISVERSLEMMVGILGILKAGGAYVPIDPGYPQKRIDLILEDIDATLVLTQTSLKSLFDAEDTTLENIYLRLALQPVYLDTLQDLLGGLSTAPLETVSSPTQLAYVMYTSGSTGTPKGVMVENRNVVRLVMNTNYYKFSEADILLSTGSFSFDATTFEYWGPLLNGGQLALCSKEVLLDSHALRKEISEKSVNVMWFTAGWFNQLIEIEVRIFEGLKTILIGGDRLSAVHINKLRSNYKDLKIINGYGPTENTTFSLCYEINEVANDIPIGIPINNSTAYILDDRGGLQAIGVTGEIYLGGDGLSRGYLNQPELTKEKFIANPYDPSTSLYKTGDLGRYSADGVIDFMGRKDSQIKIRGHRIELGEIESALGQMEAIEQLVVIAKEDTGGSKFLIAYMVCQEELERSKIQEFLAERLPEYMIPKIYVPLKSMPLNKNGKVDRKALPAPDEEAYNKQSYVAPASDNEVKLAEIWQEILKIEKISIHDNFFELGGHSLLAMKLSFAITKACGVKIEIGVLFKYATIQSQAQYLDILTENANEKESTDEEIVYI